MDNFLIIFISTFLTPTLHCLYLLLLFCSCPCRASGMKLWTLRSLKIFDLMDMFLVAGCLCVVCDMCVCTPFWRANEIAKVDKDVLPSDYTSTLLLLATTPTELSASIRRTALFTTSGRVYTTWFNTSTLPHRLYMFVLWTAVKPVAWVKGKKTHTDSSKSTVYG